MREIAERAHVRRLALQHRFEAALRRRGLPGLDQRDAEIDAQLGVGGRRLEGALVGGDGSRGIATQREQVAEMKQRLGMLRLQRGGALQQRDRFVGTTRGHGRLRLLQQRGRRRGGTFGGGAVAILVAFAAAAGAGGAA